MSIKALKRGMYFVALGAVLSTVLIGVSSPRVSAAPISHPLVQRWYGWDLEFNRKQTNNIAFGLSGPILASMGIPEPMVSKVVGASLGFMAGYAGWVYNNGGCLKARFMYPGYVTFGHYYGGNCR